MDWLKDYEEVIQVTESLYKVMKNNSYGLVNKEGNLLTPIEYSEISKFENGLAKVCITENIEQNTDNNKLVNKKGDLLTHIGYGEISIFENELEEVCIAESIEQNTNKKYGLVNDKGELLTAIKYTDILDFENGFARVSIFNRNDKNEVKVPRICRRTGKESKLFKRLEKRHNTKKWGVINMLGIEIIPPIYYYISRFNKMGVAIFRKYLDSNFGLINCNGEEILPTEYNEIRPFYGGIYMNYFLISKNFYAGFSSKESHVGLADSFGNVILPTEYDKIESFYNSKKYEDYLVVSKKSRLGLADRYGNILLETKYSNIICDSPEEDLLSIYYERYPVVKLDKDNCFVKVYKGNIIKIESTIYDYVGDFDSNGIAMVYKNGLQGRINANIQEIIPCRYNTIKWIELECKEFILVSKDRKYGVLNKNGEEIIPCEYFSSACYTDPITFDRQMKVFIAYKGMFCKLLDQNGYSLTEAIYEKISKYPDSAKDNKVDSYAKEYVKANEIKTENVPNKYWIAKKKEGYGLIDKKGKEYLFGKYKNIQYSLPGYYLVERKGIQDNRSSAYDFFELKNGWQYGFLNNDLHLLVGKKGECKKYIPIPIKYDWGFPFVHEGNYSIVELNGKKGLINRDNNEVLPLKYNELRYSNGVLLFKENGCWGIISLNGEVILAPQFDYIEDFHEDKAVVRMNEKYGVISMKGENIVIPKYDNIFSYREGYAIFELDRESGCIDVNGNEIIPPEYKSIGKYGKYFKCEKYFERFGVVDEHGKVIIDFKYRDLIIFDDCFWGITDEYINFVPEGGLLLFNYQEKLLSDIWIHGVSWHYENENLFEVHRYINGDMLLKGVISNLGKLIAPIRYKYITLKDNKIECEKILTFNSESVYDIYNLEGERIDNPLFSIEYKMFDSNFYLLDDDDIEKVERTKHFYLEFANSIVNSSNADTQTIDQIIEFLFTRRGYHMYNDFRGIFESNLCDWKEFLLLSQMFYKCLDYTTVEEANISLLSNKEFQYVEDVKIGRNFIVFLAKSCAAHSFILAPIKSRFIVVEHLYQLVHAIYDPDLLKVREIPSEGVVEIFIGIDNFDDYGEYKDLVKEFDQQLNNNYPDTMYADCMYIIRLLEYHLLCHLQYYCLKLDGNMENLDLSEINNRIIRLRAFLTKEYDFNSKILKDFAIKAWEDWFQEDYNIEYTDNDLYFDITPDGYCWYIGFDKSKKKIRRLEVYDPIYNSNYNDQQ